MTTKAQDIYNAMKEDLSCLDEWIDGTLKARFMHNHDTYVSVLSTDESLEKYKLSVKHIVACLEHHGFAVTTTELKSMGENGRRPIPKPPGYIYPHRIEIRIPPQGD